MTSAQKASENPLSGLLSLETAVLRALCLAINTGRSTTSGRIAAELDRACFYFPVTRAIFSSLGDLAAAGGLITLASLEQKLRDMAADVPSDFFLEDLFSGEPPASDALEDWMTTLRDRRTARGTLERLAMTHPSRRPHRGGRGEQSSDGLASRARASTVERSNLASFPGVDVKPLVTSVEIANPDQRPSEPQRTAGPLVPESSIWGEYLARMTEQQGEWLKTGFDELDACFGGMGPGLCSLVGDETAMIQDFLKQLVDQAAMGSESRCLYVSFERTRAELRLTTLSRLSQASSVDIELGRFDRQSARWKQILQAGEAAVEWLSRVYVADLTDGSERAPSSAAPRADVGLAFQELVEMCADFRAGVNGAIDLVVIDNLDKVQVSAECDLSSELRRLASRLGLAIVGVRPRGAKADVEDLELTLIFEAAARASDRIVRCTGQGQALRLRLEYDSSIHQFV